MKNVFTLLFTLFSILIYAQPAGTLDPTFGTGGKVVSSLTTGQDIAYGVVIQNDGKILVAGYSTSTITGKDFSLVRYNMDGSLDNTFGTNGIVATDVQTGSDDIAYSIALQTDGKIILAGSSDDGSDQNAAILRYNTNGSLDNTFGTNGVVLTDFESNQQDEIKVVKVHALTGNIVVGGSTIISSNISKPVIARYTSNGTLDTSFDSNGIRLLWVTNLDYQYLFSVEDLVVQSNGKISAIGWRDFPAIQWESDYWARRINSDGTMDNTFSTDGVNVYNGNFNGNDRAYAMLLESNNNILMAGTSYISSIEYDFTIQELSSNGTIGSWAQVSSYGSFLDDRAYGLGVDQNGRHILAGSSGTTNSKTFALTRLNSNHVTDASFGTNGQVTTTFNSNMLNECFALAIRSDNKIVAVGYTGNDFAIARYTGEAVAQLDAFQLLAPSDQSVDQDFTSIDFDWSDAFGATSYNLELDVSAAFSAPQTFSSTISERNVTNLTPNTTYYWRVRATDGTNTGNYSAIWSFTTSTLEDFSLISPANSSTGVDYVTVAFDWSDNLGATSFELQLDTTQSFTSSPQMFSASVSMENVNNLLPSKTYFWRVRASDGITFGQWSSVWSFTTKVDPVSAVNNIYFADVIVYPNPTSDEIQINTNQLLVNKPYELYDYTGKKTLSGVMTPLKTSIKMDGLERGVYLLRIGDVHQKTFKVLLK